MPTSSCSMAASRRWIRRGARWRPWRRMRADRRGGRQRCDAPAHRPGHAGAECARAARDPGDRGQPRASRCLCGAAARMDSGLAGSRGHARGIARDHQPRLRHAAAGALGRLLPAERARQRRVSDARRTGRCLGGPSRLHPAHGRASGPREPRRLRRLRRGGRCARSALRRLRPRPRHRRLHRPGARDRGACLPQRRARRRQRGRHRRGHGDGAGRMPAPRHHLGGEFADAVEGDPRLPADAPRRARADAHGHHRVRSRRTADPASDRRRHPLGLR